MSGTTQSGTPITALKVATAVAATDNVLGVVKNTDGTQSAQQVPVGVIGNAVSEAAGIPAAVTAAENAAITAQAASDASYKNATQAVNDKIGVANGAAALDSKAQLLLQGESSLAITPATAASGTTPATPAKLKPLLPLDETATVGNAGNTLGDAVSQAAGAVQAAGGDASSVKVKSASGTTARIAADRAADTLYVQDFGPDGTTAGDTAAFIAGDEAAANGQMTGVMRVAPGTTLTGDGSDALAAANRTVVLGSGKLEGFRRRQAAAEYLPTPYMFPPTIRPDQLTRTAAAAATGVIRVAIQGDSIFSVGDNLISTADHPVWILIDEIKKQNPGVDVQVANLAIGGKTWADMWSDTAQPPAWFDNDQNLNWKQFVCAYNPDILLLYSGGNDGYSFDGVAMHNLVSYYQTAANFSSGNIPDLIFGVTYQPSLGSATNGYNQTHTQNGIDFCSTYIRNYAIANNYGYLDFARWHAMCRDGIDIRELVMERVQPVAGTTLPAYETPVATTNNNWAFPAATTGIGVSAQSCTSFLICFTVDADMGALQVPLSNASANGNTPTMNPLFIVNDGGKIKCTYCDGVTRDVVAKTSTIAWPTGASSWTIVVKDGRLRVEVQQPLDNGWDISNQGAHVMGMGYVCVFDENVARFGAPYAPALEFGNNVNVTVHNLCVADATTIQGCGHRGSSQRYRPIVSDYELYAENDQEFGGSGSYHMNAYGYRLIFAPVIRAQPWGSFRFSSAIVDTLLAGSSGYVSLPNALEIGDLLTVHSFLTCGKSVTQFGAAALASQPTLTLASPTANETAIANVLAQYGMVKVVSS